MQTGTSELSGADRGALAKEVSRCGERAVRERLGVSRLALARALAGLPIRAGTVALVRIGLPALTAKPDTTQQH